MVPACSSFLYVWSFVPFYAVFVLLGVVNTSVKRCKAVMPSVQTLVKYKFKNLQQMQQVFKQAFDHFVATTHYRVERLCLYKFRSLVV